MELKNFQITPNPAQVGQSFVVTAAVVEDMPAIDFGCRIISPASGSVIDADSVTVQYVRYGDYFSSGTKQETSNDEMEPSRSDLPDGAWDDWGGKGSKVISFGGKKYLKVELYVKLTDGRTMSDVVVYERKMAPKTVAFLLLPTQGATVKWASMLPVFHEDVSVRSSPVTITGRNFVDPPDVVRPELPPIEELEGLDDSGDPNEYGWRFSGSRNTLNVGDNGLYTSMRMTMIDADGNQYIDETYVKTSAGLDAFITSPIPDKVYSGTVNVQFFYSKDVTRCQILNRENSMMHDLQSLSGGFYRQSSDLSLVNGRNRLVFTFTNKNGNGEKLEKTMTIYKK